MWSNHPEHRPVGLLPQEAKWLEEVWCGRTTPNSLETALSARFPLHQSGSRRFGVVKPSNHPELTRNCLVGLLPMHHSGSMRFGGVQQPQTHSQLPYRPASPASQEVRCGRTTLNSLETAL